MINVYFIYFRELGNINLLIPIEINAENLQDICGKLNKFDTHDLYLHCIDKHLGTWVIKFKREANAKFKKKL